MARVLIGWELGGNRGHSVAAIALTKALQEDGHTVIIAAQQPVQFVNVTGVTVLQAPIWPGLIGATPATGPTPPANMADILIGLGLSVPGALTSLIRGWEAILRQACPDVVIADYAPALLCAARKRVRTISYGNGFCQPIADMDEFPDLVALSDKVHQTPITDLINDELRAAGCATVVSAPGIFSADECVVACLAEFDPYRQWRKTPHAQPHMAPLTAMPDLPGDEVFVYFHRADGSATKLWDALALTGLKTRVFIAQPDRHTYPNLRERGFIVEPQPVQWGLIAKRSRIVISHGGLGFASGALAMGLPQIVMPHDLEKIVTALTVRKLGIGECIAPSSKPERISDCVRASYQNRELARKAKESSRVVRARVTRQPERNDIRVVRNLVSDKNVRTTATCEEIAA
jgi:rhamnosyltransferase subunit B